MSVSFLFARNRAYGAWPPIRIVNDIRLYIGVAVQGNAHHDAHIDGIVVQREKLFGMRWPAAARLCANWFRRCRRLRGTRLRLNGPELSLDMRLGDGSRGRRRERAALRN